MREPYGLISRILSEILIKRTHVTRYREDGGVTICFIDGIRTFIERLILSETDEILSAPAFPAEFQQALVKDIVEGTFTRFCFCARPDGIEVGTSIHTQTLLTFGAHQHHVSIAKEHDVVVYEFTILDGILVKLIFVHACACRFYVW